MNLANGKCRMVFGINVNASVFGHHKLTAAVICAFVCASTHVEVKSFTFEKCSKYKHSDDMKFLVIDHFFVLLVICLL